MQKATHHALKDETNEEPLVSLMDSRGGLLADALLPHEL